MMSHDLPKPTIGTTHDTQCRRWLLTVALDYHDDTLNASFDLEVRHDGFGDTFQLFKYTDGERVELVSSDEFDERRNDIVEHESCGSCAVADCRHPDGASVAVGDPPQWLCDEHAALVLGTADVGTAIAMGRARALNASDAADRATTYLIDRQNLRIETAFENAVRRHLRRYWDAFVTLFHPALTY